MKYVLPYATVLVSNITNVRINTKEIDTMGKIYGYCRISRRTQNITRQIENILKEYPLADIKQEAFTGTKVYERKEFMKLLKVVEAGDTIVFDSVSRMSRNAEDGTKLYFDLFEKGVNLVFLKESYINTDTYKKAISTNKIELIGTKEDILLKAINEYLKELAREQIRIAFDQAEKEVTDLQQRTKEGLRVAKANGKQVGAVKGAVLNIKKKEPIKADIKRLSKDFYGTNSDKELIKMLGIARNTYYKYKKELAEEYKNSQT